jgi:hypothetical protein
MRRDKTCITRKIYFYRIHAGNNFAGEPINYDIESALKVINGLSFQNDDRYLKDEDGFEVCCWIDDLCSPQKVRFGKIRRDDFPQIEHRGSLLTYQCRKILVWRNVFMLFSSPKILWE